MEKFSITFKDIRPIEYLEEQFSKVGIRTERLTQGNLIVLFVYAERNIFVDKLSELLVLFYKSKLFLNKFKKENGIFFASFLGSVIGQDAKEEKDKLIGILPNETNLNADGIFRFLMPEFDYAWRAFAELTKKLYSKCLDDNDKFALVKYFLSGETIEKRIIVMDEGLYYNDNNEDIILLRIFDDEEENLIFNIMLIRPSEIIVPTPIKYSDTFISLIKKLGD